MPTKTHPPSYYRERAEECRTIAETFLADDPRRKMLAVASEYEELASTAERIIREEPTWK